VSEQATQEWHLMCDAFGSLVPKIRRSQSVNINSRKLREQIKTVARQYLRQGRPLLAHLGLKNEIEVLDPPFQALMQLSDGLNAAATYRKHIDIIRRALPQATLQLEMNLGTAAPLAASKPNESEAQIIQTLAELVPSASLSFQQAINDLKEKDRISFRGPACELREALREVLDHLAPDDVVMASDGFKLEKDRPKPTMKQKVRFILKARGRSKSATEVPEGTVVTVEEMVGTLARSVYTQGSIDTHIASGRRQVVQLKRYVEAVLSDILEV
jgi:hypothetical protein